MLSNYNKWAVLTAFFNDPLNEFGLRELSRKVKLAPKSVKTYLKEFIKKKLLTETQKDKKPQYKANRDNKEFIQYKKINNQLQLQNTGLIDFIYNTYLPDVIILFGSFSKGEDIKKSDVDIYIQSAEKRINLEKYEKLIERKINLLFSSNFNKLSNELKNNLLNGIILKGYLKVF
ncbi:MAG TPA: nucleotidyltransferase domain-containing protein [Candidatus Nanoarchaeia archaeon]|nr:nucleotidyltransferase domain-containing protein [Candidatus Nanoarchaeia archaeon]